MVILKGWKYTAFIGSIVGVIGLALYPIIVAPILYPNHYKTIQKKTRAGVQQEDIQPGNMKIWSDPFDRK